MYRSADRWEDTLCYQKALPSSSNLESEQDWFRSVNAFIRPICYWDIFKEDSYEEPEEVPERPLEEILKDLLDEAVRRELIPDSIAYRDLFDTRLMNCLTPRPAQVQETFRSKYAVSPKEATDWFYKFSQDNDYIRRYRIKKDQKWKADSPYGEIDITINLSKPEKDPKAIAADKNGSEYRISKMSALF